MDQLHGENYRSPSIIEAGHKDENDRKQSAAPDVKSLPKRSILKSTDSFNHNTLPNSSDFDQKIEQSNDIPDNTTLEITRNSRGSSHTIEQPDYIELEENKLDENESTLPKNNRLVLLGILILIFTIVIAVSLGTTLPAKSVCTAMFSVNPIIQLRNGLRVIGREDDKFPGEVYAFLSVPYSLPPVGAGRFAEPHAIPNIAYLGSHLLWNGTTSHYPCIQPQILDNVTTHQSESCLFLNIFTPLDFATADEKYPVLVDFHAGGFIAGSNTNNNGAALVASQKFIVAHVNYRLGPFGYWFDDSFEDHTNFGYLDQRMALKFVHENIEIFGGDQDQITIIGCSAGGQSVTYHTTNPLSHKYFTRSIILSAPTGIPYLSIQVALEKYSAVAAQLECCNGDPVNAFPFKRCLLLGVPGDDPTRWPGVNMTCMREKDALEIRDESFTITGILGGKPNQKITQLFEPIGPVIDRVTVLDDPFNIYVKNSNDVHKGEMLFEITADESVPMVGQVFNLLASYFPNLGPDEVWQWVLDYAFEENFDEIFAMYENYCTYGLMVPSTEKCSSYEQAKQFFTDYIWLCNQRFMLTHLTDMGFRSSIYGVLFNVTLPRSTATCPENTSCHCAGNWYLFNQNLEQGVALTVDQRNFQLRYQNYYSNFIRTGNPNNSTGNPNGAAPLDVMESWQNNKNWFGMSLLEQKMTHWNENNITQVDERCNLLDRIGQYMEH